MGNKQTSSRHRNVEVRRSEGAGTRRPTTSLKQPDNNDSLQKPEPLGGRQSQFKPRKARMVMDSKQFEEFVMEKFEKQLTNGFSSGVNAPASPTTRPKAALRETFTNAMRNSDLLTSSWSEEHIDLVVNSLLGEAIPIYFGNGDVLFESNTHGQILYVVILGELEMETRPEDQVMARGRALTDVVASRNHSINSVTLSRKPRRNTTTRSSGAFLQLQKLKEQPSIVTTLRPGSVIADYTLVTNQPHRSTVTGTRPGLLLAIHRLQYQVVAMQVRSQLTSTLLAGATDGSLCELVQHVPIFASLSQKQLEGIAAKLETRMYVEGEQIVRSGEDAAAGLYVILSGEVSCRAPKSMYKSSARKLEDSAARKRVNMDRGTGLEDEISWLRAGDHFGEASLLEDNSGVGGGSCISYFASETAPVTCLMLTKEDFATFIEQESEQGAPLLDLIRHVHAVRLMERNPLFADLSDQEIRTVASHAQFEHFANGFDLQHEVKARDRLFLLVQGAVKLEAPFEPPFGEEELGALDRSVRAIRTGKRLFSEANGREGGVGEKFETHYEDSALSITLEGGGDSDLSLMRDSLGAGRPASTTVGSDPTEAVPLPVSPLRSSARRSVRGSASSRGSAASRMRDSVTRFKGSAGSRSSVTRLQESTGSKSSVTRVKESTGSKSSVTRLQESTGSKSSVTRVKESTGSKSSMTRLKGSVGSKSSVTRLNGSAASKSSVTRLNGSVTSKSSVTRLNGSSASKSSVTRLKGKSSFGFMRKNRRSSKEDRRVGGRRASSVESPPIRHNRVISRGLRKMLPLTKTSRQVQASSLSKFWDRNQSSESDVEEAEENSNLKSGQRPNLTNYYNRERSTGGTMSQLKLGIEQRTDGSDEHGSSFFNINPSLVGGASAASELTEKPVEGNWAVLIEGDVFGEECLLPEVPAAEEFELPRLSHRTLGRITCLCITNQLLESCGVLHKLKSALVPTNEFEGKEPLMYGDQAETKGEKTLSGQFMRLGDMILNSIHNSKVHALLANMRDRSNMRRLRLLHKTEMTDVSLLLHKPTGQLCVLKSLDVRVANEHGSGGMIFNECSILSQLNSPFVVRLLNTWEEPSRVVAALEPLMGGDLGQLVDDACRHNLGLPPRLAHASFSGNGSFAKRAEELSRLSGNRGGLTFEHCRFVAACGVLALKHLFEHRICHRDVKPCNFMLDHHGFVKLVDFGISKQLLAGSDRTFTAIGSPMYMAPELLHFNGYGTAVDWWAFGATLFELATGHNPFEDGVDAAPLSFSVSRYRILEYSHRCKALRRARRSMRGHNPNTTDAIFDPLRAEAGRTDLPEESRAGDDKWAIFADLVAGMMSAQSFERYGSDGYEGGPRGVLQHPLFTGDEAAGIEPLDWSLLTTRKGRAPYVPSQLLIKPSTVVEMVAASKRRREKGHETEARDRPPMMRSIDVAVRDELEEKSSSLMPDSLTKLETDRRIQMINFRSNAAILKLKHSQTGLAPGGSHLAISANRRAVAIEKVHFLGVARLRSMQNQAAVMIQRIYRGFSHRISVKRSVAALSIQRIYRGFAGRRKAHLKTSGNSSPGRLRGISTRGQTDHRVSEVPREELEQSVHMSDVQEASVAIFEVTLESDLGQEVNVGGSKTLSKRKKKKKKKNLSKSKRGGK